jgi:hypothetical protein
LYLEPHRFRVPSGSIADLELRILDTGQALKTSWHYTKSAFGAAKIRRMTRDYQRLLQEIANIGDSGCLINMQRLLAITLTLCGQAED